ncbi:MAG: IS1 family transposase [Sulfurovum sp.]|nr:IS1 family transposase [Sulfurovum sp.]
MSNISAPMSNARIMAYAVRAILQFVASMERIKTVSCFTAARVASALFGLHLSAETIQQIIHHAAEGVGVRATARLLGLDKDTVNRVILRAGEHCAHVLSGLLISLKLTEVQLDELWTFIKKRKVLAVPKTSNINTDRHGSGQL